MSGSHCYSPEESACSNECGTHGCRLWFGLRPGGEDVSVAPSTQDAGALLKLALRAFALPLVLFVLAVTALSHLRVAQDWLGVVALALAMLCGWYALRRQQRARG